NVDGTIATIDNCACRRIVLSFGNFWRACTSDQLSITAVQSAASGVDLQALQPGTTGVAINVMLSSQTAVPSSAVAKADLGQGVTVNSFQLVTGQPAALNVDIQATATAGPRTLTITTDDGAEASFEKAITIVAASGTTTKFASPAPPKPA